MFIILKPEISRRPSPLIDDDPHSNEPIFQIVNLPTSLPSPLYIAGEYAKRGAMLLDQYM